MNKNTSIGLVVAVASVMSLVGCEDKATQPPLSEPKPAAVPANNTAATPPASNTAPGNPVPVSPDAANLGTGQTVTAMGVSVTLPDAWKRNPPANQMRLAEASVADAGGDPAKACLVVFSTAGGSVADNISRWAGQVRDAQGQPVAGTPTTKQVGGVNVTTVEMTGTFAGMGDAAPKENWMLRGAIIETTQGLLFIKMTGPAEGMKAALPGFNAMVESVKKS
ncbi:MAG: hypothetical protein IT432_08470 [Phycisphaerales bacterium]|nr:hypothetical protein [Phycisphaerales bacterium]